MQILSEIRQDPGTMMKMTLHTRSMDISCFDLYILGIFPTTQMLLCTKYHIK